jgi:sialic acid synthase SpsE
VVKGSSVHTSGARVAAVCVVLSRDDKGPDSEFSLKPNPLEHYVEILVMHGLLLERFDMREN